MFCQAWRLEGNIELGQRFFFFFLQEYLDEFAGGKIKKKDM